MRKLLFIVFFLFLSILPTWGIDGIKYKGIDSNDGLSHNTVRHIMQDSKGFIWISTMNGLNRYDGNQFVIMQPEFNMTSLTENTIKKTLEDKNGYIWVLSTSDFVDCYNTHTESFVDYGSKDSKEYSQILQSSQGDIWLYGTKRGACRIQHSNGKLVTTSFHEKNIGSNTVHFIYEDNKQNTWIGTDKALFKINHNKLTKCQDECYKHAIESNGMMYFFNDQKKAVLFNINEIVPTETIELDSDIPFHINTTARIEDNLILITGKEGIKILNTNNHTTTDVSKLNGELAVKNADLYTDNVGNCWIYNNTGTIWLYQKDSHSFKSYELIPSSILALIDLERYALYVDSNEVAWVTTYGNGLFCINLKTNETNHLTTSNSELKTNYLLSVSEDRDGNIWVGTEFTGITCLSFPKNKVSIFIPQESANSKEDRIIRSIFEDRYQNIWIGTKNGNLYLQNVENESTKITHFNKGMPYCITEDKGGNIWVATKGGGIAQIRKEESGYLIKTYNYSNYEALGTDNVYTIIFDSKNRMWIGTYGAGLVLGEADENNNYKFIHFPTINKVQDKIRCITEDGNNNIWIGGNDGLIKLNPEEFLNNPTRFAHFKFDKNSPYSLSNNEIKSIYSDTKNNIWIGTSGGGVSLLVEDSQKHTTFKHYSTKNGLVNNVVQAITSDKHDNIWISTEAGLSKLNSNTWVFENFTFSNNWSSNLFCESVAIQKLNGELLFGSHNGMYTINPDKVPSEQMNTPITLTKLTINGNIVSPQTPESPLKRSISETSAITLNHSQNTFSIDFASLRFNNSRSDRYTYLLEDFDDKWSPVTTYNVASYKNLDPGKYTFRVKSYSATHSNPDETSLEIIITPPFWKTWQAFWVYFAFLILIGCIAVKLFSKMNRLNNEIHIEKQLTEYKLKFFTNISHEFRTPLTIIRASIESMRNTNSTSPKTKKQINILDQSSLRLMNLIDQLLEFRRIQSNQLELNINRTNPQAFFHNIYAQFEQIALSKNIDYTFELDNDVTSIPLDCRKIDKIIFNLLSNAFRNTPKDGHIKLKLSIDNSRNEFQFSVSDSGPGIPKEKLANLFVRFKSADYNSTGMGIGLNLTQELVDIHRGNIQYKTSEWNGASFNVSLPLLYPDLNISKDTSTIDNANIQSFNFQEEINNTPTKKLDYSILIIEDDNEIRNFLTEQLEAFFSIYSADNGLSGLELAEKKQVDLIICDVMMPEMNGYELTKKLKSDFETSHIPVILLTSCSSIDDQIEGIDAGADSYITKPFSFKYLYARIIKLIEQREKLKIKLDDSKETLKATITTGEKDRVFIEQVNQTIESEIANSKFNVENFANSLHISRTLFYKKIKRLTGYGPNEYIRAIRLQKAAGLLINTELNVSEIAYQVGFNDPFYFSKCFKEEYKKTPTEYRTDKHSKTLNEPK